MEIREKIIQLYKQNKSIRSISKEVNRSTSYVSSVLQKEKIYEYNDNKKSIGTIILEDADNDFIAICKKTGKTYNDYSNKSGALTIHIKKLYPETEIPSKFKRKQYEHKNNSFWHEQFFDISTKSKKNHIKCQFCEWKTSDILNKSGSYTLHLKEIHKINAEDFLLNFPQHKEYFKQQNKKNELKNFYSLKDNFIECKICNQKMKLLTNSHLKKHDITKDEYKKKFINAEIVSKTTSEKISISTTESNIKNFQYDEKRKSGIEKIIGNLLEDLQIPHIRNAAIKPYLYDYYIKDNDMYLELDGLYWHGHDRQSNWHLNIIKNIVKDHKKTQLVNNKKLIRLIENFSINPENIKHISSKDSLFNFFNKEHFDINKHSLFNLTEDKIIFNKQHCIDKNSFIGDSTIEDLYYIMKNFYSPHQYEKFINLDTRSSKEFFLKGIFFDSFYSSHKYGNPNLFELFKNDKNLKKVIEYRLGKNKAKEFFDITIKNIYRGLEVRNMFNVGVFPVKKAQSLYELYIKVKNSIIYDPFAGWGSRLLGCRQLIKEQKCYYIANDINESLKSGYSKLIQKEFLDDERERICIRFCDSSVKDDSLTEKVDFIFTSPPFYNDEIYSEKTIFFKNEHEWINNLLIPIFKNCFTYLKKNSYFLIDMKDAYCDQTIIAMQEAGFIYLKKESYKISKSHYAKKDKIQNILFFKKP